MKACAMIKEAQRGAVSMAAEQKTGLEEKVEKLKTRKRNSAPCMPMATYPARNIRKWSRKQTKNPQAGGRTECSHYAAAGRECTERKPHPRALEEIVDISSPKIDDNLIDRFVEVVTPVENYSYRWKLNFGEKVERKDRTNLCEIATTPILKFTITFEDARYTARPIICRRSLGQRHGRI